MPLYLSNRLNHLLEVVMARLGAKTDFVGYDFLIDYARQNGIPDVSGDICEIGAFMGGGTRKLLSFADEIGKLVYVIDVFDPSFDRTTNSWGQRMDQVYSRILGKRSLIGEFRSNTSGHHRLRLIHGDSTLVAFPPSIRFAFAFVDGNHSPQNVISDFNLVWEHMSTGGVIAMHDYQGDLPSTTAAIDECLAQHSTDIPKVVTEKRRRTIFIHKVGCDETIRKHYRDA